MPQATGKLQDIPASYASGYLSRLDGRTAVAAEMRARWSQVTDDLGGEASLSYIQKSLVERALWLEWFIAAQERTMAEGGDVDIGRVTQATNTLLGLYRQLGIERRAKDVTPPSLATYLAARAAAADADDAPQMPGCDR